VSPGTEILGSVLLQNGAKQANSSQAAQCTASIKTTYNQLTATMCKANQTITEISGLTLIPGMFIYIYIYVYIYTRSYICTYIYLYTVYHKYPQIYVVLHA
jgi:hypothetical protein